MIGLLGGGSTRAEVSASLEDQTFTVARVLGATYAGSIRYRLTRGETAGDWVSVDPYTLGATVDISGYTPEPAAGDLLEVEAEARTPTSSRVLALVPLTPSVTVALLRGAEAATAITSGETVGLSGTDITIAATIADVGEPALQEGDVTRGLTVGGDSVSLPYTATLGAVLRGTASWPHITGEGAAQSGAITVTLASEDISVTAGGAGEVLFSTTASGDTLTITVAPPSVYAGTYNVSLSALTSGPVLLKDPVVSGVLGLDETLTAITGLWAYDSTRPQPVLVQKFIKNGSVADPNQGSVISTGPTYTQTEADFAQGIIYRETISTTETDAVYSRVLRATPAIATYYQRADAWGPWSIVTPDLVAANSDGTGAVAVGEEIRWLRDLSGLGMHLKAPDGVAGPTLVEVSSGVYCARFAAGTNQVLQSPTIDAQGADYSSSNDLTIFAGRGRNAETFSGSAFIFYFAHTTAWSGFIERATGNRFEAQCRHLSGTNATSITSTTALPSAASVLSAQYLLEESWSAWEDDVSLGSLSTIGRRAIWQANTVVIGGTATTGANSGPVDIYEVCGITLPLTNAERELVVADISGRMGL